MLVPDINHAAAVFGQSHGPIHVRIAEEREAYPHALLRECPGKDVVDAELGFSLHFSCRLSLPTFHRTDDTLAAVDLQGLD